MPARSQGRSFPDWSDGVGTFTDADGVSCEEIGNGPLCQTVFTFSSAPISVVDSGANGGHGSIKLYDFPAGYIKLIAAHADLDFTAGTTGLTTTATHEIGVGTTQVATDNAALSTTEENIIAGVATDLTASAITYNAVNATDAAIDGTGTALDLYLNTAWAADDCSANDTVTVTGTLTVTWINFGDD